jgi:hypothetical protein
MTKAHTARGIPFTDWKPSSLKKTVEKELRSLANDIDAMFDYHEVEPAVREDFTALMAARGLHPN